MNCYRQTLRVQCWQGYKKVDTEYNNCWYMQFSKGVWNWAFSIQHTMCITCITPEHADDEVQYVNRSDHFAV